MRWVVIPIHIKIGEVQTMGVENWNIEPDDRQTLIQTIGGVAVQDFGHCKEGDKISCEVTIHAEDATKIYQYWHNRELVNVEDEGGNIYENMRVRVKKYQYLTGFKKYLQADLEFWRV